jgi:hypothetical protein
MRQAARRHPTFLSAGSISFLVVCALVVMVARAHAAAPPAKTVHYTVTVKVSLQGTFDYDYQSEVERLAWSATAPLTVHISPVNLHFHGKPLYSMQFFGQARKNTGTWTASYQETFKNGDPPCSWHHTGSGLFASGLSGSPLGNPTPKYSIIVLEFVDNAPNPRTDCPQASSVIDRAVATWNANGVAGRVDASLQNADAHFDFTKAQVSPKLGYPLNMIAAGKSFTIERALHPDPQAAQSTTSGHLAISFTAK